MTKARRMMQEDIKLIDLVIELLDARVPFSSRNPDIDKMGRDKARLILPEQIGSLRMKRAMKRGLLFRSERVLRQKDQFQKWSRT